MLSGPFWGENPAFEALNLKNPEENAFLGQIVVKIKVQESN